MKIVSGWKCRLRAAGNERRESLCARALAGRWNRNAAGSQDGARRRKGLRRAQCGLRELCGDNSTAERSGADWTDCYYLLPSKLHCKGRS